jgi:hypothetical protein
LISATSTITSAANITGGNVLTGGLVSATGNIISGSGSYFIGNGSQLTGVTASSVNANALTGNTLNANVINSSLTSVGNLTSLSVVGNTNSGNFLTAGLISATSTITSAANITGGNILTGGLISATGNVNVGNLLNAGLTSVTGNITGGNILTAGQMSSTGNAIHGNILTGGLISATGNITGGNVLTANVVGATGLTLSTGSGSITFNPVGNVLMSSRYINNLADPIQDQDAATKVYVDNVAQGLDPKASVTAATVGTLAAASGGTITYNNGTSGVGATLTTTGTYTTIDGVSIATVGSRVLVKNEVASANNGIYTYTSATVLTRAVDMNIWAEVPGAFTFVETGSVNADSGYVCTSDVTGTMGTTAITWSQFSSAGSYTANTSAGLSLIGSQFNAKVDGVTTAFDGSGNISVKTGAQLTTPNIGAATGTSLSVTGAVTSASVVGGVITGSSTSVTGTVTAASVVGGVITGTSTSVTGTTTAASVVGGVITGSSTSVTGNVTGGNVLTGGLISATSTITSAANITGGNVLTGGLISATSTITSAANITGGNLVSSGQISASGNVSIGTNYYLGNGSQLTGIITSVANINNGTSNVTVVSSGGNVTVGVGGTGNVAVFATTGEYIQVY